MFNNTYKTFTHRQHALEHGYNTMRDDKDIRGFYLRIGTNTEYYNTDYPFPETYETYMVEFIYEEF